MRLIELDPRWFTDADDPDGIHGVTFQCPHCRAVRLGVSFANPINAKGPVHLIPKDPRWEDPTGNCDHADHGSAPIWQRSGETFDTLTLTPSIDAAGMGHWHGFITNGDIR